MEIRFKNKVAFITGAAGGIGYAAARMFAEAGASVVMADLDSRVNRPCQGTGSERTQRHRYQVRRIGRGTSESGCRKGGRCFRQVGYSL